MSLRKRFRSFRDWCPQPSDGLSAKLRRYSLPVAAVLTATLILSVSFMMFSSSLMSRSVVPIVPLANTPSSSTDNWSMFLHDSAHTGFSTSSSPATSAVLWTFSTGNNPLESSPAVANGSVYIGSTNGNIYCLNATTGALKWVNLNISEEVFSSPAVDRGYVYFGGMDGSIYCLNAYTGALEWNVSAGSLNWIRSSPAVANGYVYIEASDGTVYCLNALTGSKIWSSMTGGSFCSSSPAIAGGYVYVGSWDDSVYCLNALTGVHVWMYQTGAPIISSPSVAGGYVYVQSGDGNLYCLAASDGAKIWSYPTKTSTTEGPIDSSAVVVNGRVYAGSNNGNIYCLDAINGTRIWANTGFSTIDSCAVAGGCVFVSSDTGTLYCINASNGATIWTSPIGADDSAAVYNGVVYVGTSDSLVAFGTASNNKVFPSHPFTLFSNTQLLMLGFLVAVVGVVVVIRVAKRQSLRAPGISSLLNHGKFHKSYDRYRCDREYFNVQKRCEAVSKNE